MNKIILALVICFIPIKALAGDFVCGEGTNIRKRISCGRSCSIDTKCIRVDREQSIVNKKLVDGKLIDLTQEELDAIADAKAQAELEASKVMTVEKLVAVLEDKAVLTKTEVETKEITDVQEITK